MEDVFVGRDDELARGDRPGLVLISGEPGIGKSRLADELAARTTGCVVWGRAWEGEGTPAYWPWLEILRALAAEPRTAAAIAAARDGSDELAALLAMRTLGDPQARFRLLDAIAGALRAAAGDVPLAIVLDDLHAADAASLELLAFVARGLRGSALRVIATTRDAARPELEALLARIAREATCLPLRRLTREEVARWIDEVAPVLRVRAGQLFENSDGNPLFVAELIAAWQRETPAMPLAIGDAIRAHLAQVPAHARDALDRASVLGREPAPATLRALELDDTAIEAALATRVLVRTADDRLRFSHVLVRDEIYATIPIDRRRALHATAARALAAEPEQAVRHVFAALDAFAPDAALATILDAVRAASSRLAFADAAALCERALATPWEARRESALRTALGEAQILADEGERGRASCARAAELAGDDAPLLARAALAHASEIRLGRQERSITLLRRALGAGALDERLEIQLLGRLATSLVPATPEEGDEPLRLAREAVTRARALGDEATILSTQLAITSAFTHESSIGERYERGVEVLAIARRIGQLGRVAGVPGWQIACRLELGQLAGARDELRLAGELFASLSAHHAWRHELLRGLFAALEGEFAEARAIARRTIDASRGEPAIMAAIQLMAMPYVSGDASTFAAEDDAVVTRVLGAMPGHEMFGSIADALAGRVDRVAAAIASTRGLDLASLPGAAQLGWPIVHVGLAEHAERFYGLVSSVAARSTLGFVPNAVMTIGSLDVLAARLAKLADRDDGLVGSHLARARAFADRLGAPAIREQVARAERELGGAQSAIATPEMPVLTLERHAEMWAMRAGGREVLLEHRLGLAYLAVLVAAPHREVHVLELVGGEDAGDAGPLLDERAKRAYHERADALRETLAEAERNADLGRMERAREELDALANELARATGLGGRDRRAASQAERARINVQRRLRDVIGRVTEHDAALGRHLELSVKTGVFCRYAPTWERSFRGRERR